MSGSCHSSYIVVNMKLLQIAISKVAHCQEFRLELSLGQDLHQCEVIGAYLQVLPRVHMQILMVQEKRQYCTTNLEKLEKSIALLVFNIMNLVIAKLNMSGKNLNTNLYHNHSI